MSRDIRPFLMFEGAAEEAMTFYVSVFQDAQILNMTRYGPGEPGAAGSIKRGAFRVGGQTLLCTDSPIKHGFSRRFAWVNDRYGVSWQLNFE